MRHAPTPRVGRLPLDRPAAAVDPDQQGASARRDHGRFLRLLWPSFGSHRPSEGVSDRFCVLDRGDRDPGHIANAATTRVAAVVRVDARIR